MVRFGYLLLLAGGLGGCQASLPSASDPGFDYQPLEPGRYVEYAVSETRYALNAPAVQRTYQLREEIGQPYRAVDGDTAYTLLRFRRSTAAQNWQTDSIWTIRRQTNAVIRTENGLDFVSLLFPARDGQTWNGNRLNALGEDDYTIRNAGQPYRVSAAGFDQTVTVVAQDDSTLVSQDKRLAVYARGVGLIYRERIQLQYCSSSPACIGTNQIDYGTRQYYRLTGYGTR
ncbi:hypothetical protein [Spirosoma luteolum]